MDELQVVQSQYNLYPNIISYPDRNVALRSPHATTDLHFYQTKETLMDVDVFRNFLRNAETRFRASKEYKAYKSYLIENIGINRCQIFGNINVEDADIELHHNVLGLFDICLLIASHVINTVGMITTFDLIELLIQEHYNNRVGVTFLSETAHQIYTNDPEAYIPPEMTFGRWWELLADYRYGITYDLANKIIRYINNSQNLASTNISIMQNEEILGYAYYNEYGWPKELCGELPDTDITNLPEGEYSEYGF